MIDKNQRSGKKWTTHMPLLIKLLLGTTGSVLEVGSGPFSTPLLHWLCSFTGRKLVTYENVPSYYKFAKQFQSKNHSIRFVNTWDELPVEHYQVVFIDHEPSERRITEVERFKDSCDYMIIHDTEEDKNDLYHFDRIDHFKYRKDFSSGNRTTVFSKYPLDFLDKVPKID